MNDSVRQHWDYIYDTRELTETSWYEPVPTQSMTMIRATEVPVEAPIIDVGGGASMLVDILVNSGYTDISILDISGSALAKARERLGDAAGGVKWIESDITEFETMRRYYLWHDRAVFHFLTGADAVQRYLSVLRSVLVPTGHFVLATFGPEGPDRCSGLEVERYSIEQLTDLLEEDFELRAFELEDHATPSGTVQQFLYSWWQAK